jgi:hypothetical protein
MSSDDTKDKTPAAQDGATWSMGDYEWNSQMLTAHKRGPHNEAERACGAPAGLVQNILEQSGPAVAPAPAGSPPKPAANNNSGDGTAPSSDADAKAVKGRCQADNCSRDISALTYYHIRNR